MRLVVRAAAIAAWMLAFPRVQAQTTAASVAELDPASIPWANGETLAYDIDWGMVRAAQGTFRVIDRGHDWEFRLVLRTVEATGTLYPIQAWFWSIATKSPWRSIEAGEERFQNGKHTYERSTIDYAKGRGRREQWDAGKTQDFATPAPALDDFGSMLYSLRYGRWTPGQIRQFLVYETRHMRGGEARCQAIEKVPLHPADPSQTVECIRLLVEPLDPKLRAKGNLVCWLTNDTRRLPIRAELKVKFGSFRIQLREANPPYAGVPSPP
jgi:hypothetical protein